MDYKALADKVLGMLQRADGNDPSRGHLTMNNWEWPTGVALYGVYKTWQQSGDRSILDYLTGWYDDMLSREHRGARADPHLPLRRDEERKVPAGDRELDRLGDEGNAPHRV